MTRLFIENNEVELDESTQFAITKQFEELSNPTAIINDWSKTVSIPFTQKNNQLFGHIYNEDKTTLSISTSNLLPNSTIFNVVWTGSEYNTATLEDGKIVYSGDVEYLKVCFLSQDYSYEKTLTFNCINDSHSIDFVYNGETDYFLCFELINTDSSATSRNRVRYVVWQLNGNGLEAGKTYTLHFQHKVRNGKYIVYNFTVKEKEVLTGLYFNPLLKLGFRLQWNDAILMTGYAKMNDIKQTNEKGTYNVTLFGQLGRVFQEMKKITFDTSTDEPDYLIDGENYVSNYITRDLVCNLWNTTGQTSEELKHVNDNGYNISDIIGFAPNNSFSEGFEYTTYQSGTEESNTFTDILGTGFTNDTGVEPSTAIPNGLLPREIGEYRSYLQLPYIYWNKLFQIFQEKSEEITGYNFDLDSEWFNKLNPYWHNLVYMLKPLDSKNEETRTNLYKVYINSFYWNTGLTEYTTEKIKDLMYVEEDSTEAVSIVDYDNNVLNLAGNNTVNINSQYSISLYLNKSGWKLSPNNGIVYCFKITDENDNVLDTIRCLVCDEEYTGNTAGYYNVTRITEASHTNTKHFYPNLKYALTAGKYGTDRVKIRTSVVWLNNNEMFIVNGQSYIPPYNHSFKFEICGQMYNAPMVFNVVYNRKRSYNHFDLNDLWNNDYNLFNEILNYCKMYRILIYTDDINKKIVFTPYYKYFSDYNVLDWTDKVDKSKDYTITPVSFEDKYILFNYEDGKNSLSERYKEKYGVNYGEYRLTTAYNFNSNTNKLFDKIKGSITNTDNVLSWTNIYDNHKIIYSFPAELYVYNKDKDKKQVDTFGNFYFHTGLATFSTEDGLYMRPVIITDDTLFQQSNNKYFYIDTNLDTPEMTNTLYYPKLDVVYGDKMCLFNIPNENYTYLSNYSGKSTIYTNFWEAYLNERYNVQNKKITCYIGLSLIEYKNFSFKNFVKIGNQLCIVNKIYDYDITNNNTTKVDLITIQDINAYTDDTYTDSIDELSLNWNNTTYYNGTITTVPTRIGTFNSVTDVTFANGEKEYTVNGVKFTITGNTVYNQRISRYVEPEDIDFTVTLMNKNYTTSFACQRYSIYPYPYIEITDSGDNVLSELQNGARTYTLTWAGTDTSGSHPNVTFEVTSGSGTASISGDWTEDTVTIQQDGEEWTKIKYSITLNTNLVTNSVLRVTVTDSEGWYEARDYTVISAPQQYIVL